MGAPVSFGCVSTQAGKSNALTRVSRLSDRHQRGARSHHISERNNCLRIHLATVSARLNLRIQLGNALVIPGEQLVSLTHDRIPITSPWRIVSKSWPL